MNTITRQKILQIIEREAHVDLSSIDFTKDWREQISLDSIQLIGVASALEQQLGISLPLSVLEASSIDDLLGMIANRAS